MFPIQNNQISDGVLKALQMINQIRMTQALPQQLQQEMALKQAETQRQQTMASLPFGGQQLSGVAGHIVGLETIRQAYGAESPQYQQAKKSFDLEQESDKARINYQNVLSQTAPTRALTPGGRGFVEEYRVNQGYAPTGTSWEQAAFGGTPPPQNQNEPQRLPPPRYKNLPVPLADVNAFRESQGKPAFNNEKEAVDFLNQKVQADYQKIQQPSQTSGSQQKISSEKYIPQDLLAPGSKEELSGAYQLLRQKNATPNFVLERIKAADNIDKTLARIDVNDLVRYSGVYGGIKGKLVAGQSLLEGKTDPQYMAHQKAAQDAELLATQVRQFYKDSIQPKMIERLETLTNPSSWTKNPDAAKALFEETKKILELETQTYRDSTTRVKATEPSQASKDSVRKWSPETGGFL